MSSRVEPSGVESGPVSASDGHGLTIADPLSVSRLHLSSVSLLSANFSVSSAEEHGTVPSRNLTARSSASARNGLAVSSDSCVHLPVDLLPKSDGTS